MCVCVRLFDRTTELRSFLTSVNRTTLTVSIFVGGGCPSGHSKVPFVCSVLGVGVCVTLLETDLNQHMFICASYYYHVAGCWVFLDVVLHGLE